MKALIGTAATSCIFAALLLTGCGGGGSNSGGSTPSATQPTVSSITPATVMAGSGPLSLTVSGTGFLSTTTVQVGGVADVTSYVSSSQVTATVSPTQLASGAQLSVIALNGSTSSGSGAAVNLQVTNPSPVITLFTPSALMAGAASPTLTLVGTGFVPETTIDVNGSARTTIFVSPTQVSVTLSASDVASTGSLSLTAVNAVPGGGTSTAMTVPVNNPAPIGPFTLSPPLVFTGTTTPTTVTVTGRNFIPASTVELSGAAVATTYVSATQLTFQLTVEDEATSQQIPVAVMNPAPGGGTFLAAELNILPQTATPVITQVSPSQFVAGSGTTPMTVYGSNLFAQLNSGTFGVPLILTSSVQWNGATISNNTGVEYGGNTVGQEFITIQVPANLLASAGTATVTVTSTTATPALSNALTVTIGNAPAPMLTSISPNTGPINTATTVYLYGTGFANTSAVALNGTNLTTAYLSSTQLSVTIPASSIASPGIVNLTVKTPAPGGGTSAAVPFTAYNPPAPTLTQIYPNGGPINSAATVTLYGTGFAENSTVAMNGTSIAATYGGSSLLTVTIPASSVALPGNLNFTVTTPAPGGGTTAPLPYTAYVGIPNNDLVYNPADGLLYVSVPSSAGSPLGNSIVGIDPVTGNTMRSIFVGSNPNKLALSSDGTQLFVGLDGTGALAQVNLTTGHVTNQFLLGEGPGAYNPPYTAAYLAAVPGEPNSVAVAATGTSTGGPGVTIYDSGVARAKTSSSLNFGDGALAFGSSASTLYMMSSPSVYEMTVDSTGITGGSTFYSSNNYSGDYIQYDNGSLYLSSGVVLDASTAALLGTFYATPSAAAIGPMVSDSTLGLAFIASSSELYGSYEVLAFNEGTFDPTGNIGFAGANSNTYPYSFDKIVRWGENGLALNTPTQIFIFQSPVVKDLSASPADLSVALSAPATASTGSTISYAATVLNKGPNQAQGVTLALTLDPSLIVNSVTASQSTCGSGSVFSCDLGTLANGASATVTISATPSAAGTIENTLFGDSVSYDPNSSNNQASASTTVAGNIYSAVPSLTAISPALVQAGSGTFILTITGNGFNSGSTVNLNGIAVATTYVSASQLTANVDGTAIVNYGWAPVTVTNPAPGGGTSQIAPLTIYALVNVQANDILFDPYSQRVYATLPSASTGPTGNSVLAINPATGAVGTPVNVGSEPSVMAETTDGNNLFIGLNGANSLVQFDLLNQQVTATIPISSTQYGTTTSTSATWLAAMPGSDTSLAMDVLNATGDVSIFDVNGNTGSLSGIYSGEYPAFADATHLYAYGLYSGGEFYRYSVNANGLTLIDETTLNGLGGSGLPFQLVNGVVYGSAGGIINPSTTPPSQTAMLPLVDFYQAGISPEGVGVAADPSTHKDFLMLENNAGSSAYALVRYDTIHYLPETWVPMPTSPSSIDTAWTMLRWGQDGLVLLLAPNTEIDRQAVSQILLMRGPFVTPQLLETNSAATLTSSSIISITHGAGNALLTLTGTNFLPGVAVTWNGSYRTTTIIDASHVIVAIPASDLASAGSGSLVAINPGAPPSSTLVLPID